LEFVNLLEQDTVLAIPFQSGSIISLGILFSQPNTVFVASSPSPLHRYDDLGETLIYTVFLHKVTPKKLLPYLSFETNAGVADVIVGRNDNLIALLFSKEIQRFNSKGISIFSVSCQEQPHHGTLDRATGNLVVAFSNHVALYDSYLIQLRVFNVTSSYGVGIVQRELCVVSQQRTIEIFHIDNGKHLRTLSDIPSSSPQCINLFTDHHSCLLVKSYTPAEKLTAIDILTREGKHLRTIDRAIRAVVTARGEIYWLRNDNKIMRIYEK